MAELLPRPFDVRPKLRLVTSRREREEVRFRFPAEEEVWEVSCEADEEPDETPERGLVTESSRLRARSRRAS